MTKPLRVARPPDDDESIPDVELLDVPASEIKHVKVTWLWADRLEWGTVAIVQGAKGVGKSTWLRALAADVTGGPRIPGTKAKPRKAGAVLWYAGEESLKTKVAPGLKAAGAIVGMCYLSDCRTDDPAQQLQLPADAERLEKRIRYRAARLVVLDPVFNFSDGTCDLDGPTVPMRRFMHALAKIAERTDCLIVLSRNLVKSRNCDALASGRGGGEMANASRSVLHLQRLPDDPMTCALAVAACNEGRPVPTLTYTLEEGWKGQPVIRTKGESGITADELVAGEEVELERTMVDRAKALIRTMLPSGKLDSRVIKKKAENAMISIRTLQAAAKQLGIRMPREGSRESTITYWTPPARGWGA